MGKKKKAVSTGLNDELELEQAYHKESGKARKKVGLVITIVIMVFALTAGVLAGCLFSNELEEGIIMNNVSIAGVNVGGMTKEEAVSALRLTVADSYTQNPMVVIIADQQVTLTPELTEVTLDVESAVETAYALGRTGNRSQQKEEQLLASTTGITVDIRECLYVNTDAISAYLETLNLSSNSEVVQTTWEIAGEIPDLTTEEAPLQMHTLLIHKGIPSYTYDQEALLAQIMDSYVANSFITEFACEMTVPDPIDFDDIYQQNYAEPVDSAIDTETYEATSHSYGYAFDTASAAISYESAQFGTDIEIPFVAIAPAQTKEALGSVLFRDVLSSHKATGNSSYNRNNNLKLACQAIDGTIIMPGEVFDYNETTGKRTTEKGYLPADGYAGGKTVKMVGGGVCQPSSIIYYCALLADMEIVTRSCHQFISSYMDPGMDATVSWGGPHFRFRNNTDYPIRIDASASGASVTISIVGTETKDYYVKMEYEILSKTSWTTEYVEMEADNEEGYKNGDVITTPYTGYTVKTYRCRYSKADDSLIERVYEAKSVYDSRNKQIAKIVSNETTSTGSSSSTTEATSPSTKPTSPSIETTEPSSDSNTSTTTPTESSKEPTSDGSSPDSGEGSG